MEILSLDILGSRQRTMNLLLKCQLLLTFYQTREYILSLHIPVMFHTQ